MQMESQYLVSAKSEDAIDRLFELWEDANDKYDDCSFEGFATDVFEIMESVIKVVYAMEKEDKKEEFTVVGKCETDYDCVLFMIEYTGTEPMIKSSQADPEENEGRFFMFDGADYDEIPDILKRNKFRTFKKAIKDEIPLGGFLDEPYERWYQSIISKL